MQSVLHIFPSYGTWLPTPQVLVLKTKQGQSITSAHIEQYEEAHQPPLADRDSMFTAIAHPAFRARWADIIVHSEPYTEKFCARCNDMTFWLVAEGHDWCEQCGLAYESQWLD